MAKQVQKRAAKDYPQQGIKKGDMYWFAEVKTGPRSSITIRSSAPIARSRLTASEFLSQAYDLSDRIDKADTVEELESIKDDFESLKSETEDKLGNMPEGLQQGQTGELLQERIDQIDSLVSELDSAIQDVTLEEEAEGDEPESDQATQVRAAVEAHISNQF
jgi:hypothetical protein